MNWTRLATIERTHERATAEKLGVSRHFIRQAVKDGRLPCVRAGRKALIDWGTFLAFLDSPPVEHPIVNDGYGEIRAVSRGGL